MLAANEEVLLQLASRGLRIFCMPWGRYDLYCLASGGTVRTLWLHDDSLCIVTVFAL